MITARGSDVAPIKDNLRPYTNMVWRIVEAHHRISTNRLAVGIDDQALLEALVEEVKPLMPKAARTLHYLLATPFRYGYAKASRFRRANERPGTFYASEHVATAVAETAYWRLLFYSRSPAFVPPTTIVEHSAFTVPIAAARSLDLTAPPFDTETERWANPSDYGDCQRFASAARAIETQAVRYASVRGPEHRPNLALFDPAAFAGATPTIEQTWHFRFEAGQMTAFAAFPSPERYAFSFETFGLAAP